MHKSSGITQAITKTVYIIAGPTAVGKTAVAIEVAKRLGTEIVSADSRQCYREMTIGTAKPGPGELKQVTHYFIDAFPVTEGITASDYEKLALDYLSKLFQSRDTAVVTGGTGLYIKALTEGLDDMPAVDEQVAEEVDHLYQQLGQVWLQQAVKTEDPVFYAQAEIDNPARLIRALVFKRSTGESIIAFRTGTKKERPFRIIKTALELPRPELYDRINHRVDLMMEQGLLEEVRSLLPYKHLKNLQTVGYAELIQHLEGKCSLEEAVSKIKQHTRNYAKRQLTWFRKDPQYTWFSSSDPEVAGKITSLK